MMRTLPLDSIGYRSRLEMLVGDDYDAFVSVVALLSRRELTSLRACSSHGARRQDGQARPRGVRGRAYRVAELLKTGVEEGIRVCVV